MNERNKKRQLHLYSGNSSKEVFTVSYKINTTKKKEGTGKIQILLKITSLFMKGKIW